MPQISPVEYASFWTKSSSTIFFGFQYCGLPFILLFTLLQSHILGQKESGDEILEMYSTVNFLRNSNSTKQYVISNSTHFI